MDEDFIEAAASAIAARLLAANAVPLHAPGVASYLPPRRGPTRSSDHSDSYFTTASSITDATVSELSEEEIEDLAEQIVTELATLVSHEELPADKIEI